MAIAIERARPRGRGARSGRIGPRARARDRRGRRARARDRLGRPAHPCGRGVAHLMGSRFAIVIDGTAALPDELARAHDIRWLPVKVILGGEAYIAATTAADAGRPSYITTGQFYERIRARDIKPETSAPNIEECLDVYQAIASEGTKEILVITIATEL